MPRGRKAAPANETKAQCFIRIGTPRVNKAITAIDLIGNLAGSSYEYTDDQINMIESAIKSALDRALNNLRDPTERTTNAGFNF